MLRFVHITIVWLVCLVAAACFKLHAADQMTAGEGVVVEVLPEARFRVRLDNDHEVLAYSAGRMKKNRIKTLAGDRVTVEMTPYDLSKGRITYRHKTGGPIPATGGGRRPPPRRR